MAIRMKPGDRVDHFLVQARLEDVGGNSCSTRYSAVDVDTNSPAEIWSYNTPGSTSKGFKQYKEACRALLRHLEAHADAAHHVIRIHGVYDDVVIHGYVNSQVVLVTEPAPPSLISVLDGRGLDSSRRWSLARQLAFGVAALHTAGINWGLIDPWHIGVREDGSPVLLDLLCARICKDFQHWDLPMLADRRTAPELVEGEDSSPASDVYALAATLVRLLTSADAEGVDASDGGFEFLEGLPAFDHLLAARALRDALSDDPASRPSASALAACFADGGGLVAEPRLPVPPDWLTSPMQALAFWVAYQHNVYRHHDLPEGAIVAEFTRLLDSEFGRQLRVVREPLYRDLLAPVGENWHDASRCDLAVMGKGGGGRPGAVEAALEVKRANVADAVIEGDLLALHQLKVADPSIRTFLLLVAQAHLPRRWVSHLGTANADGVSFTVVESGGKEHEVRVRVRRVAKAAHSFRSIHTATYCCLLEVLP